MPAAHQPPIPHQLGRRRPCRSKIVMEQHLTVRVAVPGLADVKLGERGLAAKDVGDDGEGGGGGDEAVQLGAAGVEEGEGVGDGAMGGEGRGAVVPGPGVGARAGTEPGGPQSGLGRPGLA